jgi:hypothetical protein
VVSGTFRTSLRSNGQWSDDMRLTAKWGVALMATVLTAGEIDPRLLRLIGPEARLVYGLDLERYDGTALSKIFPSMQPAARHVIGIAGSPEDQHLSVIVTAAPMPVLAGDDVIVHRGVAVRDSEESARAVLSPSTAVVGRLDRVLEAIDRWLDADVVIGATAAKARDLSRSYDNWFLLLRPLDLSGESPQRSPSKYRVELAQAVEEIRGGLRIGATNDVTIEVVAKSAEEATAWRQFFWRRPNT